jgi:neutral amino acid transport system ATP-binding protein
VALTVTERKGDRFEGTGQELLNNPKIGELYLGAAYKN